MTDPSTEAIPETTDAPGMLAHIEAKVSEFETWAKNALAHVTEHTHAAPLGRLLGTLAQTAKEIENLKSTGVMFALQQPLEAWLDKALGSATKRADGLIEAFVSAVDAKLGRHSSQLLDDVRTLLTDHATQVQTTLDALASDVAKRVALPAGWDSPPAIVTPAAPAAPAASTPATPATPVEAAPTAEQLATLDGEPSFPTLAEFVAQGFYADTYEYQKAEWLKLHQSATPTHETPAENAPSDLATGASSGSA